MLKVQNSNSLYTWKSFITSKGYSAATQRKVGIERDPDTTSAGLSVLPPLGCTVCTLCPGLKPPSVELLGNRKPKFCFW